jgi:predicted signal transduction protein with EAL and GGDEF domain
VVNEPVRLAEATLQAGASVGLAVSPEHGQSRADLLHRADIAMYVSKARHGGLSTFVSEMAA